MLLRFTEFVTRHEQDIGLYVIREDNEKSESFFSVQVWADNNVTIILCKKIENNWDFITQDLPQWIQYMKIEIIEAIEQRISQE